MAKKTPPAEETAAAEVIDNPAVVEAQAVETTLPAALENGGLVTPSMACSGFAVAETPAPEPAPAE